MRDEALSPSLSFNCFCSRKKQKSFLPSDLENPNQEGEGVIIIKERKSPRVHEIIFRNYIP